MIKYIIGDVKYKGEDYFILDNNGMGYKILTSSISLGAFDHNKNYLVHTYMAVREDDISLYGFYDEEELEFFELLIGVTSIGPKNALSILSSLDISSIVNAINNNDINTLCQAKGVGKKTASRIILELSDKVSHMEVEDGPKQVSFGGEIEAAIDALTNLGYSRNDVVKAMAKVETADRHIEDIIKECILILSKS